MKLWKGAMWKAPSSGTDPEGVIDCADEVDEPVELLSNESPSDEAARDDIARGTAVREPVAQATALL